MKLLLLLVLMLMLPLMLLLMLPLMLLWLRLVETCNALFVGKRLRRIRAVRLDSCPGP